MRTIKEIIESTLEELNFDEDSKLVAEWNKMFEDLDESAKSNLVRILIGHGAIKKENGKLVKNKEAGKKVLKKIGIKS